jgi:hypothetical protein
LWTTSDAVEVEGASRQSVDARHRHHVSGGKAIKHPKKFASVEPRARYFLTVNVPAAAPGRAQLFNLALKSLPVGADAGIADKALSAMSFGHVLRQTYPSISEGRT